MVLQVICAAFIIAFIVLECIALYFRLKRDKPAHTVDKDTQTEETTRVDQETQTPPPRKHVRASRHPAEIWLRPKTKMEEVKAEPMSIKKEGRF